MAMFKFFAYFNINQVVAWAIRFFACYVSNLYFWTDSYVLIDFLRSMVLATNKVIMCLAGLLKVLWVGTEVGIQRLMSENFSSYVGPRKIPATPSIGVDQICKDAGNGYIMALTRRPDRKIHTVDVTIPPFPIRSFATFPSRNSSSM